MLEMSPKFTDLDRAGQQDLLRVYRGRTGAISDRAVERLVELGLVARALGGPVLTPAGRRLLDDAIPPESP